MQLTQQRRALKVAIEAALSAGQIMTRNSRRAKEITASTQHDIKLELDERCQRKIERILTKAFPDIAILGEEGVSGDPQVGCRWVVDPIDGTVNFTYGIPHACVSIALQQRVDMPNKKAPYETLAGVVYDPFCDELFTAIKGQGARLNGRLIQASRRERLEEAIVSIGFAKTRKSLDEMLPAFRSIVHRVRKIRILGAAALGLAYVAAGRLDAYLEVGLRLWDIAAGGLILDEAGGDFHNWPVPGPAESYGIVANNGLLRKKLQRLARARV